MIPSVLTFEGQDVLLIHKPNVRAKRLSLRLSSREGAFVLTIPPRASVSQINGFLKQCAPWVRNQLGKLSQKISVEPGAEVSLNGELFRCTVDPLRRKPALCKMTQTLRLPPHYLEKDIYALFKKIAEKTLSSQVNILASQLGQLVEKVTVRDQKSRWGSCSRQKTISLNWRLILAPPEVAHYVCAHEVAHLLHMNHSPAFWKVVREICPAYLSHKKWLKINGPSLMRF